MILNNEYKKMNEKPTLVLIHGLFGSLSNLGMLARAFVNTHNILQVDVRNHGKSEHSPNMNYEYMAQDIIETLDHFNIQNFILIGHSMGGKIAMKLSQLAEHRLEKLIVLDMAPFAYSESHHTHIFEALFAVKNANIVNRSDAIAIMKNYINEEMVIQFLLKSFHKGEWLFNVDSIYENYSNILSWDTISTKTSTLFIRGGNSPYISKDEHVLAIKKQFLYAEIQTIEHAGHWLHAEKSQEVIDEIRKFIN